MPSTSPDASDADDTMWDWDLPDESAAADEHGVQSLEDVSWTCGACFQTNSLTVEAMEGQTQSQVMDCWVCCRPNYLTLHWDEWSQSWQVSNELLGG